MQGGARPTPAVALLWSTARDSGSTIRHNGGLPLAQGGLGEGETRRAGLGREERRERRREESLPDGKIALFGLFLGLNAMVP